MPRVINGFDARVTVRLNFKSRNAAIVCVNPDGAQQRRIERAHQVKSENTDRAGVRKDSNRLASMFFNQMIKFV